MAAAFIARKCLSLSLVWLFATPQNRPPEFPGILHIRILEWIAYSLLQGLFLTQGSNPGLLHCRQILYCVSHQESQRWFDFFLICYWPSPVRPKWGAESPLTRFVCVLSHSVMFDSATPWTAALQAPLSVGFSRQEYWSGLPFSAPRDLPDSGINTNLLHWQVSSLLLSHLGSPSARCGLYQ